MDGEPNVTGGNLPQENNNPGDLRFAGQANASQGEGGFADFPTPQDGYAALLNDVQSKINKDPQMTLEGFSDIYAPEDDGNDPASYTAKLANQIGVNPDTTIGSLEPDIGKFADAIANNEGYTAGKSSGINAGTAAGVAGAAALGGGAAVALAPEIGEGEGILSTIEGLGSKALDAIGLGGLLGGNSSAQPTQATTPAAPAADLLPPTPSAPKTVNNPVNPLATTEYPTPTAPTEMYNSLEQMLGSTVTGQKVMQEAENKNLNPMAIIEQSGAGSQIQPDADGNINRPAGVDYMNKVLGQQGDVRRQMVNQSTSPTHLDDMETWAKAKVAEKMADTGELGSSLKEVGKYFDDARAEQPMKVDKNGKSYRSKFIDSKRLLKKYEMLSVKERDYTKPQHERDVATHIKAAMRDRLAQATKQDGIQGFDELTKSMQAHIIARKAIKALPKKAPRDKKKEFRHDVKKAILGAVTGGIVGKLYGSGHAIAGGLIGAALEHQLQQRYGNKEYKKIGAQKDIKKAEERAKKKGLIKTHP